MEGDAKRRNVSVREQFGLPDRGQEGSSAWVSADEIAQVLDQTTISGREYVRALIAVEDVDGPAEALLRAWRAGLPFTELTELPEGSDHELLSPEAARSLLAVPLGSVEGIPLVAVADLEDGRLARVTAALGTQPRLVISPRSHLREALGLHVEGAEARSVEPLATDPPELGAGNAGLGQRAAKGVLWTAAGNWGTQAATFAVFIVLSRLLDPASFGLVALAAVFVGLVQLIANQGMLDALVQRRTLDPEHLDTAFWTGLGVGLAAMAVLAAIAYPIGLAVHQPRLAPVVAVLAISIPIGSTNLVQRALMTRELAFRSLTVRTLVATAVGSIAGIVAALAGLGVWSLVAQNLANVVAGAAVLWTLTPWRPRLRFSRRHFHDLFGYGVHVVAFKILNYLGRRGDDLLIGSFLGATALGFYSVAYRILTMITDVTTNLVDAVAFPVYARLQDDPERLRTAYHRTSTYVALVSFPVFSAIVVLAPQIVEVCFGDQWADSAPVMQVLSLVGCLQAVNYLNSTMLKALGKPSWRVVLSGITMVLSVGAFFAVVQHGILAVAIALVVASYVSMPLSYVAIDRLLPLSPTAYLVHLAGPLLGSFAVAGAAYGAREALDGQPAAVVLVGGVAAGTAAYVATIFLLARPVAREILRLLQSALGRGGGGRAGAVGGAA